MCGGEHYGEVEGLVSVERWSCSRGASCVVEYITRSLRDWSLWRGGLVAEVLMCGGEHYGEFEGLVSVERWSGSRGAHVWWRTLWGV